MTATLYEYLEDAHTALLALNQADDEDAWMTMHQDDYSLADFEKVIQRMAEARKDYDAALSTARDFAKHHGLDDEAIEVYTEVVFSALNLKNLEANATNNADAWAGNIVERIQRIHANHQAAWATRRVVSEVYR